MAGVKLEHLPKELIAHIATFVEGLSVINLSITCRTLRSACWDSLVFKQILTASQHHHWRHDTLNIEAISRHAGNDPSIWARYAVADDNAHILASMNEPLRSRRHSIRFLPELAVVKHPFLKDKCWYTATHGPFDYLPSHVFGLAMAVLSADEKSLSRFHDPGQCEYCFPKPREDDPAFLSGEGSLWTLCSVAITLDNALKLRHSVWPYNHAANIPHIGFPRADRIPLRPLNEAYGLPVPFSRRVEELLGRSPSSLGGWNDWYRLHNHAMYKSTSLLTEGGWCGYYTYNETSLQLDPPMMQIHFRREGPNEEMGRETAFISADDCVDGVGGFTVRGTITWNGNVVSIAARKAYHNGTVWDWDCRLTPFGIVGHWGTLFDGHFRTDGYVWLWKKEWTDDSPVSYG